MDSWAHSLEDPTVEPRVTERRAASGSENIGNSMHDACIKENAKVREQAGLDCYLVRDADGGCCKWCQALDGKYPYATAPDDIFRRHDNCKCNVTYICGKKRQDVWSKKTWEEPEELKARKEAEAASKPVVNSKGQAKELEKTLLGYEIKSSSEIKFSRLDSSADVDKKLLKEYRNDYDKFTKTFGELPIIRGFNVMPYTGGNTFGGYNPHSNVITLIGIGGKSGRGFITQIAVDEHKKGQWSTSSMLHTFRHELGHALQDQLQANDMNWGLKRMRIKDLFDNLQSQLTNLSENDIIEFKKKKLSIYGFDDVKEFISESVAEYINNPNKCRSTAKQVVEIILYKGDDLI